MPHSSDSPFADEIYTECIGARARSLTRAVSAIYEDAMRPFKVRFTQMNILVTTAKLGDTRPADICRILQLDHSTVSRSVDRMVERGWLALLPDTDGRTSPFRITDEGLALVHRVHPAWKKAQEEVKTLVGKEYVQELREALKRLHSPS